MDNARKKAIKLQLRRAGRQQFLVGLPMPTQDFMQVLDEIADAVDEQGCDHTLRHFQAACRERAVDPTSAIAWLGERGAFCDCEAVDNITGWLEDAVKEAPGPSVQ